MKSLTQTQNPSLTSPTTVAGTGSDVIAPHETNAQAPTRFSDVFSCFECKLNCFQSAIQTLGARTAALTTVDQDADAAMRLVLSILTRRNMLAPISILPADILAHIFRFNAFSAPSYSPTPTLGWIYVTHVCRRWRQVALDNSTLWTHFWTFPRDKDWIAERLSRARNAPLVIDISRLTQNTFSLFTPHISHTRELCLRGLSFHDSEAVQEFSMQEAPALERLELSGPNTFPMETKHLVAHSFFKGQLPKLRVFCISQIVFPWSLVPRSQLTQLKVTLNVEDLTPEPEGSSRDNLNQLVDLLINCLALEVLTLENCLPATLDESSGGQTIHLPRLSRLCLDGSSSRVTNFLKMLKLSSSTTLRLNCTPGYSATLDQHLILPVLSAHFNDPTPTEFRSFKILLSRGGRKLDMVASTSFPVSPIPLACFIEADTNIDIKLRLSLSFRRIQASNDVVGMILRRACDLLPLSKLEFLSILSPVSTQVMSWGELFRHCTEVTTVQVYGHGTTGLLQALTPPQHSRGKGRKCRRGDKDRDTLGQASENNNSSVSAPVQVPIFPKLTSLVLERLDFTAAVPGSGVLYDLVLSAVKRRKAKKTPLSTLRITLCMISAEEAAALEKIVRDFHLDHNKVNEDEDEHDEANVKEYYDLGYNDFD